MEEPGGLPHDSTVGSEGANRLSRHFHRRLNKCYKQLVQSEKLPDLDVYVLARMYEYVGHLIRVIRREPAHLTGKLIDFRDSDWKEYLTETAGSQGHPARFHPWNWEYQYHSYFRKLGKSWKDAAQQKQEWRAHRRPWIEHMLGKSASNANYGIY